MTRALTAIAAAGVLALASTCVTNDAQAQRCRGCGIGLGIVGGLAAGAIIGGAAARPYGYYGGPYGYYDSGYYGGPYYASAPCGWHRERFWDGFRWRVHRVPNC